MPTSIDHLDQLRHREDVARAVLAFLLRTNGAQVAGAALSALTENIAAWLAGAPVERLAQLPEWWTISPDAHPSTVRFHEEHTAEFARLAEAVPAAARGWLAVLDADRALLAGAVDR